MRAEHPDQEWLHGVKDAIESWLEGDARTPTSQIVGGGAIAHGEAMLSARHDGRPALLMASATYALWVALLTVGVRPGDEVLIPRYDWTSGWAVVRALGARPVVAPVDPDTLTIDAERAGALRTDRTTAVIATHLFGVPSDIATLRRSLPGVAVVEDCAQAFGSTLDGRIVGTSGDAAVFSFGPGKRIDAGELGALVLRDAGLREEALRRSAHPLRQHVSGIAVPTQTGMSIRPHPLAAILLTAALERDRTALLIAERASLAAQVRGSTRRGLIGADARRGVASAVLPLQHEPAGDTALPEGLVLRHTTVRDIASIAAGPPSIRRIPVIARERATSTEPNALPRGVRAGRREGGGS